jgi:5-formyltetrahydrofolate cyclo-ligase
MIFDSLGMGELLVIFALIVFLVNPKQLGKVMKEMGKYKRKFSNFQAQVRTQIDGLTAAVDAAETQEKLKSDKAGMRKWAKATVQSLPAVEQAAAAQTVVKSLCDWPSYQSAKVISCFAGALGEIDTMPLLRRILADGKTLLVPYVKPAEPGNAAGQTLGMAPIKDAERDLEEGAFHILEPRAELRSEAAAEADLIVVPGLCFDLRGGRLGKGLGFYDKYLAGSKALRVGIGFDVQITQKNLALDPHDQLMDAVVTEKRFLMLSAPRPAAGLPPSPAVA